MRESFFEFRDRRQSVVLALWRCVRWGGGWSLDRSYSGILCFLAGKMRGGEYIFRLPSSLSAKSIFARIAIVSSLKIHRIVKQVRPSVARAHFYVYLIQISRDRYGKIRFFRTLITSRSGLDFLRGIFTIAQRALDRNRGATKPRKLISPAARAHTRDNTVLFI